MDGALVGRDRELAALDTALAGMLGGRRCVLVLSGEPGIGKTSLLEALASRVLAQGGVAAWGRMWEVGLTPSFWPWIQLLTALETPTDPAPALGSLEGHLDASARLSRFAEVRAFLHRRAAQAPVALLLDDVHAADPSSLQLLEYLLPDLAGRRVLVALAARDSDATPETAAALGRLQRGAERLPLARLDAQQVRTLVAGRADAERVFELSDGNPLFVEELLASQHSQGQLGLPRLSSVRAVIRERVARLPSATRSVLSAAAVVGRDFRGDVVAAMVDLRELGNVVQPALQLGMLHMTSPDRFRFSHALVAEAITDELDSPERAQLHLRAARAIERLDATDVVGLAHHLLAAGHLAAEAAVAAATRAARNCMAQLAFEDAAALLERALLALSLGAPHDRRQRAQLLSQRAEALQHAAQHPLAAELCDEAAGIVRALAAPASGAAATTWSTEDAELFGRIAWIRGLEWNFGRTNPRLVALLREALGILPDTLPALRAKLLARLAAAEQPAPDPNEPVARALEAIEMARDAEARERLDTLYVATAALVEYLEPQRVDRIHDEVLELARGRDRWITLHTLHRRCFVALELLDRSDYDARVAVFAAEAEASGLRQWTRHTAMLLALPALLDGRFAVAERAVAESEAISKALGDVGASFTLTVHRAMAAATRTAPVPAGIADELLKYVPGRATIAAWLATLAGDREATRVALGEVGERVSADPDLAAMLGAAVAFAGDQAQQRRVYDLLAPRSGRIVVASMVGSAIMDLYDRLLLMLASGLGDWPAVELHAERGLAVANRIGSPVWVARLRADLADACARRAGARDVERAAELRRQALEAAECFEMPGLTLRLRAVPASAEAPPPRARATAPSNAEPLELQREGGLWRVSGFGEVVHVKDSRGLQMLARLVQEPGSLVHVLDLVGAEHTDGGDAGPALDARARAQYRARAAELMAERDEAEAAADRGRLDRANHELELLTAELERAFGLGGRERRVGSASERARSNAQRRIAHALEQVRAASARLGEHLVASVRTGTYCAYQPK